MHDLIAYLSGGGASVSITALDDSVNGHLCVFAAENARLEGKAVQIGNK